VNEKQVPLEYKLKNGDVVRVETTKDKVPVAMVAWVRIVESTQAQDALKRYFNKNARVMCAVIGCVKLLATLSLSAGAMTEATAKVGATSLTAEALIEILNNNKSPSSVGEFLISLAKQKSDVSALIAKALGVSPSLITSMNEKLALMWAGTQEKHGWEDKDSRNKLLVPLLDHYLKEEGLSTARAKWCELVGPKSLTDEHSQYYSKLASKMQKRRISRYDVLVSAAKSLSLTTSASAGSAASSATPSSLVVDMNASSIKTQLELTHSKISNAVIVKSVALSSNEPAPMQMQEYPRPMAQKQPGRVSSNDHSEFRRATYIIARSPYCLEASMMPPQFIRNAKRKYATRALYLEKA
jgi:hypothetical protein